MTKAVEYNACIDTIKGIACMMLVFIHCKFPGFMGQSVSTVAHFAAPFFFMVSGYFCYKANYQGIDGCMKKIRHIIRITLLAYLFYFGIALIDKFVLHASVNFDFSLPHILHVAVFSKPYNVPGHLWFLFALLNVYIFYFFIDFLKTRTAAYYWAGLMFLALVILDHGGWLFRGYDLESYYYHNGIIEGFAFFMLGYFLHDRRGKLTVSNRALWILIVLSVPLTILEQSFSDRVFHVPLFTYPMVTCMFIYAIKNGKTRIPFFQKIGRKYSAYVYVLHIFVWDYFARLLHVVGYDDIEWVRYVTPLVVFVGTLLLSMVISSVWDALRIKYNPDQTLPIPDDALTHD